jgi:hypothetical protein
MLDGRGPSVRQGEIKAFLMIMIISNLVPALAEPDEIRPIGVLATGEVLPQECPLLSWLRNEPGFFLTLIPTKADFVMLLTLDESRRLIRLYFPRTREELERGYGFLAFVDTDLSPFTSQQVARLRSAVEESGLSAFVALGGGIFTFNYGMWASSSLADLVPHDFLETSSGQFGAPFRVEVNRRMISHPF